MNLYEVFTRTEKYVTSMVLTADTIFTYTQTHAESQRPIQHKTATVILNESLEHMHTNCYCSTTF